MAQTNKEEDLEIIYDPSWMGGVIARVVGFSDGTASTQVWEDGEWRNTNIGLGALMFSPPVEDEILKRLGIID